MSSFFGQAVCNIRTPSPNTFLYTRVFFQSLSLKREDLSTGLLLEHMPQLSRRAFVGVDFLSASTWVKCVKIMQGPMPQAGGWLFGKNGGLIQGFPCDEKGCLYVSGKLGEINLIHSCKLYSWNKSPKFLNKIKIQPSYDHYHEPPSNPIANQPDFRNGWAFKAGAMKPTIVLW